MEEKEQSVSQQENVNDGVDYISAINDIKKNSVPRADYEKIVEDNRKLLDSIVNGTEYEHQEQQETVDVDALRKKIFQEDSNLSNLDYWKNVLALRKALIEKGETDPFVPSGKKIVAEQSDYDAAERVASVVQECIDYADGDSIAFTNELQRRTIDTPIPKRR